MLRGIVGLPIVCWRAHHERQLLAALRAGRCSEFDLYEEDVIGQPDYSMPNAGVAAHAGAR